MTDPETPPLTDRSVVLTQRYLGAAMRTRHPDRFIAWELLGSALPFWGLLHYVRVVVLFHEGVKDPQWMERELEHHVGHPK